MEEINIIITSENAGERLDSFLTAALEGVSRSYIQKLIADEQIRINDKIVKANYKLKCDDFIYAEIPEALPVNILPEKMDLEIVYEDNDVIVVNKPAGLVVHPAHGHYSGTLVNGLLAHCQDLSGINGQLRPGIVHRIDKDTSGLIMAAKNDFAHQALAEQLKNHTVERAYIALCQGIIAEPGGIVDAPIGRAENDRKKMAVTMKNSKEARTHYIVKKRYQKQTLVQCRLDTGRTHQIRVHMAYIGHPLVGDPLYGQRKNNLDFSGQALHAYLLGFVHPRTGEKLSFQAPLPKNFENTLNVLAKEAQ